MQIQGTDVELSTLFGHSCAWAQVMIAAYLHSANSENPTGRGRPKVIDSDKEKKPIQLCLVREPEQIRSLYRMPLILCMTTGCKSTGSGSELHRMQHRNIDTPASTIIGKGTSQNVRRRFESLF
jgi:hypothetical protein